MIPECTSPAWWLPYVQPFATVALGIGAAALAYRQWRTAHEKLRLDLFDKRIAALEAVRTAVLAIFMEGGAQLKINECHNAVMRARLLFGADVEAILVSLDELAVRVSHGEGAQKGPLRKAQDALDLKAKPYLRFEAKKPWL